MGVGGYLHGGAGEQQANLGGQLLHRLVQLGFVVLQLVRLQGCQATERPSGRAGLVVENICARGGG